MTPNFLRIFSIEYADYSTIRLLIKSNQWLIFLCYGINPSKLSHPIFLHPFSQSFRSTLKLGFTVSSESWDDCYIL